MKKLSRHLLKIQHIKEKDKFLKHAGLSLAAGVLVGLLAALIHAAL